MRQSIVRSAAILGVLAGVAILGGCSSDEPLAPFVDTPAEVNYNAGIAYLQQGDYKGATKKFEEVDQQHPYSEWARKSLIMTTYTNYTRGDFTSAITSGKRYLALYPGSEDAAYAQWMIAQSYFNQIPDVTRDQKQTQQALDSMSELVQRYPDSPYAAEGKKRMDIARDQLAGKEMEVGRYYLNRNQYIGAINRFKTVITQYQTTRHVEEALERLTEAYFALGVVDEAQTAAAVLGHNYPDSRWYKDAYTLLQTKGLEPRENGQSWISKAFKAIVL
ncbi:outer membrane protein assembly factor BamD [Oryzibacter oryziterrae]|uniref:outer membrane protein assembly factor BamD n=1 Tax=Oryzibacter oryziterrae TaxID=2766474 RepID=UPI001F21E895|nr:outer membrane protein assembly factor BamD [Oryzibacter oryziterrae]